MYCFGQLLTNDDKWLALITARIFHERFECIFCPINCFYNTTNALNERITKVAHVRPVHNKFYFLSNIICVPSFRTVPTYKTQVRILIANFNEVQVYK